MTIPLLDRRELEARLDVLLTAHPGGALVFDADGTLWSHDVGHAVFEAACLENALHADATHALIADAARFGIEVPVGSSLEQIADILLLAYRDGRYPEKDAAEMQVWIYVGQTEAQVREFARRTLVRSAHAKGVHEEVLALAAWARSRGAMTAVVSASPRWVVEEAVRDLGFPLEWVAGGIPNEVDGLVCPGMREPLPYGPTKVTAARALLGDRAWLASFGDSGFDLDMLAAAQLAVGIGENSALTTGLRALPHGVRFARP